MKKILFSILFLLVVQISFSQTSSKRYNSYLNRYEYFDGYGNMTGYEKWNSYKNQWEYYSVNNTNAYNKKPIELAPVTSNVDTGLINNVLATKQKQYDNNYSAIKGKIDYIYSIFDNFDIYSEYPQVAFFKEEISISYKVFQQTIKRYQNSDIGNSSIARNYINDLDYTERELNKIINKIKHYEQNPNYYIKDKADNRSYIESFKVKTIKTKSGLEYVITEKGSNIKPTQEQDIVVHYAGYLEDGTLFDTSVAEVAKANGTFNAQRSYQPIPYKLSNKTGLIPGFIEGLEQLNFGDKALIFIPTHLGYGEKGGGPIPPNTNIVFEVQIAEKK